uniref:Uncharacterized protein n=1 Tax=Arundo donax TaxID=35708 RepID=A0A0A9C5Y1_ARUDO
MGSRWIFLSAMHSLTCILSVEALSEHCLYSKICASEISLLGLLSYLVLR